MSEPWTIEGEARRLCGCLLCRYHPNISVPAEWRSCRRAFVASGIRSGLAHAASLAHDEGKDEGDWKPEDKPYREGYEDASTTIECVLRALIP